MVRTQMLISASLYFLVPLLQSVQQQQGGLFSAGARADITEVVGFGLSTGRGYLRCLLLAAAAAAAAKKHLNNHNWASQA